MRRKAQIDCYGFEATSEFFKRRKLETYLFKESNGAVYECFAEGAERAIHRLDQDADGCVRITWAWGAWADAPLLDYIPLSETREIEREED